MKVKARFRCGHVAEIDPSTPPRCVCGETVIARVTAPAPRFTGHVRGPAARTDFTLPPSADRFDVKEQSHG